MDAYEMSVISAKNVPDSTWWWLQTFEWLYAHVSIYKGGALLTTWGLVDQNLGSSKGPKGMCDLTLASDPKYHNTLSAQRYLTYSGSKYLYIPDLVVIAEWLFDKTL